MFSPNRVRSSKKKPRGSDSKQGNPDTVNVDVKFNGRELHLKLPQSSNVGDLKRELVKLTNVPVGDQKLHGFRKAKRGSNQRDVNDLMTLSSCLGPRKKLILIGTPAATRATLNQQESLANNLHVSPLNHNQSKSPSSSPARSPVRGTEPQGYQGC